jgi:hypothetical protein
MDGFEFTTITEQKNSKKQPESIDLQCFQVVSWFGFERKAL